MLGARSWRCGFVFPEEIDQFVGHSLMSDGTFHAFLWENGGPMIDLNGFVPPNSDLALTD